MPSFQTITGKFCLLLLLVSAVVATPAPQPMRALTKRAPGDSEGEAITVNFDTSGWPGLAEENCYAMLCLMGGRRIFQRQTNLADADQVYRDSGASFHPFYATNAPSRHVEQITSATTSAEEFPWRSIKQGLDQVPYIFPGTLDEQSRQGAAITNGYEAHGVGLDKWFEINFTGDGATGTYCRALFSNPPDRSVCDDDTQSTFFGQPGVKIANFVWKVVKSGALPYAFVHMAGPNKGKYTKRSDVAYGNFPVHVDNGRKIA